MNISKELLSKVLNTEVKAVGGITNSMLVYLAPLASNEFGICGDNYINIYELAHKCKERAFEKNYWLPSNINSQGGFCQANYKGKVYQFQADTEPEAIFKACEWIKDNK